MQPNPSVEDLADGLGGPITYLLKSAEGDIFRDFPRLDPSSSQIRALFSVERAPSPPAVHELAAELQSSMTATGRAVDVLVGHGLAERHEDSGDRRVKRISATPPVTSRSPGCTRRAARICGASPRRRPRRKASGRRRRRPPSWRARRSGP